MWAKKLGIWEWLIGSHPCLGRGCSGTGRWQSPGRLPAFPRNLVSSEELRVGQMGQSHGPNPGRHDRTPGSFEGWVRKAAQDSLGAAGPGHQEELWFLSPSAAQLTSLASACSASGLLWGKCLCHGNITEDSGLGWGSERTESLHKPEHEETDSLPSREGDGKRQAPQESGKHRAGVQWRSPPHPASCLLAPTQKPRETSARQSWKQIQAPWPLGEKRKFYEKRRKGKTKSDVAQQVKSYFAPPWGVHAVICNSLVKHFFMRVFRPPAVFPGDPASVELSFSLLHTSGAGRCGERVPLWGRRFWP